MNISFIIPVYNVEKYIKKAIMSIIDSNWGDYKYEIVVVDDESPDNSITVVQEIKNEYPDSIIKIIFQKNKGLGGARNTGLKNAEGDYIFFLDSDDYILSNTFHNLLKLVYENQLDVLEFGATRVDEGYEKIDEIFINTTNNNIYRGEDYVNKIDFANSACNKLYNREFLIANSILFIERVYIEDAPFNVEVFAKASKVMATDIIAVAYLQNTSSITRNKRTSAYLLKFIKDSITVTSRIDNLSILYNNIDSKNTIKKKVAFFVTGILWMILKGRGLNKLQKKELLKQLKEKELFPYYQDTGSLSRTLVLFVLNLLGSLRVI